MLSNRKNISGKNVCLFEQLKLLLHDDLQLLLSGLAKCIIPSVPLLHLVPLYPSALYNL